MSIPLPLHVLFAAPLLTAGIPLTGDDSKNISPVSLNEAVRQDWMPPLLEENIDHIPVYFDFSAERRDDEGRTVRLTAGDPLEQRHFIHDSGPILIATEPAASDATGKLMFVRDEGLWIAASDGTDERWIADHDSFQEPALSPDGRWIAVTVSGEKEAEIRLISTEGVAPRTVKLPGIAEAWSPAFTQDGRQLAIATRFDVRTLRIYEDDEEETEIATHAISMVDLESGRVRHLTKAPDHYVEVGLMFDGLAVSADGRFIAYNESGSDVSGGIVVQCSDGKAVKRYPVDPASAEREEDFRAFWRPRFSPDGNRLLCYCPPDYGEDSWIYSIDLDTMQGTRLVKGGHPIYVDGGKAIMFERHSMDAPKDDPWSKTEIWRLDLAPDAKPRLILKNAGRPAIGGL